MLDFQYYSPTRVVFGRNAVKELGNLLKAQDRKKVLLHYGGGSVKKNGVFDAVVEQLKAAEIDYVELGGVAPNPKIDLIREGVKLCKTQGVDFILAVGGGSVIDSAKAIALGAKIDFDVWRLYETKERIEGALPVGSVLTIAAAGSELSDGDGRHQSGGRPQAGLWRGLSEAGICDHESGIHVYRIEVSDGLRHSGYPDAHLRAVFYPYAGCGSDG